jgi:hypothetical protein
MILGQETVRSRKIHYSELTQASNLLLWDEYATFIIKLGGPPVAPDQ